MDYTKFHFYGQEIINVEKKTIDSVELLLRIDDVGSNNDNNYFPSDLYEEIIKDEQEHMKYLRWLEKELTTLLKKYPLTRFYLNIDYQELDYNDTFIFLEHMKEFKNNLLIDITEAIPFNRKKYFDIDIKEKLKKLKTFGFSIALDDVCSGMNSLGNVLEVIDSIDRLKFSIQSLKKLDDSVIKGLIKLLENISLTFNKELVIEGVEDEKSGIYFTDNIISKHQGYFYSKPCNKYPLD